MKTPYVLLLVFLSIRGLIATVCRRGKRLCTTAQDDRQKPSQSRIKPCLTVSTGPEVRHGPLNRRHWSGAAAPVKRTPKTPFLWESQAPVTKVSFPPLPLTIYLGLWFMVLLTDCDSSLNNGLQHQCSRRPDRCNTRKNRYELKTANVREPSAAAS